MEQDVCVFLTEKHILRKVPESRWYHVIVTIQYMEVVRKSVARQRLFWMQCKGEIEGHAKKKACVLHFLNDLKRCPPGEM